MQEFNLHTVFSLYLYWEILYTLDLYSHVYDATNIEVANNFDIFLRTD